MIHCVDINHNLLRFLHIQNPHTLDATNKKHKKMTANSKEWIQYATATLMVVSGVVLSFISFFTKDDVTDGVLWYMAQALTFAGAIFGVNVYFRTKLGESETKIKQYIDENFGQEKSKTHSRNNAS